MHFASDALARVDGSGTKCSIGARTRAYRARRFAAVLVSQLSIVVHFYHPLVHWLAGRLRLEQELAADSVAAQIAEGRSGM